MPATSFNHFQDAQEEFWKVVYERYSESEITEFKKFFVPLFYLPDDVSVSDSTHPLNIYGADNSSNIDRLRTKIVDSYTDTLPDTLLRRMFEEEDHPIYEALHTMIRKYQELGNYMRNADSD